jgi:hypothetical protein
MDETLEEIILRKGFLTDKWHGFGRGHSYISFYDSFFRKMRYKKLCILEVGIYKGASIRLWEEYFPNSIIHGLEIVEDKCFNTKRIISHHGSSIDSEYTKKEFEGMEFDIIIDDGSHTIYNQISTFKNLYPFLKKGGYYIIEDIQNLDRDAQDYKNLGKCTIVDRRMFKGIPDDVLIIYRK